MELKQIVAKNLIELRKIAGITQLELAEKLSYSDKAVSKWERGESLPDVETIKKIASIYGVTVDCLLRENKDIKKSMRNSKLIGGQKALISIISAVLVWVVATFVFAILCWVGMPTDTAAYVFIAAIPLMLIVLLVFNSIWGKVWMSLIFVSAILWSVSLCIYLILSTLNCKYLWLCFIVPIPIQIAFALFYGLKILNIKLKRKNKAKETENPQVIQPENPNNQVK